MTVPAAVLTGAWIWPYWKMLGLKMQKMNSKSTYIANLGHDSSSLSRNGKGRSKCEAAHVEGVLGLLREKLKSYLARKKREWMV